MGSNILYPYISEFFDYHEQEAPEHGKIKENTGGHSA